MVLLFAQNRMEGLSQLSFAYYNRNGYFIFCLDFSSIPIVILSINSVLQFITTMHNAHVSFGHVFLTESYIYPKYFVFTCNHVNGKM